MKNNRTAALNLAREIKRTRPAEFGAQIGYGEFRDILPLMLIALSKAREELLDADERGEIDAAIKQCGEIALSEQRCAEAADCIEWVESVANDLRRALRNAQPARRERRDLSNGLAQCKAILELLRRTFG
jgi:hypothetical protein